MIEIASRFYENNSEILELVSKYDSNKLYFENLPYAKERDNYKNDKKALWSYGGVNAMNHGILKSLKDGYEYICHLDHDDWWLEDHLGNFHLGNDLGLDSLLIDQHYNRQFETNSRVYNWEHIYNTVVSADQ